MFQFLIIALTLIVFFIMAVLRNKNKSLHFAVLAISLIFLFSTQFIHFDENHVITLVLLTVLFANFYKNHRKAFK